MNLKLIIPTALIMASLGAVSFASSSANTAINPPETNRKLCQNGYVWDIKTKKCIEPDREM